MKRYLAFAGFLFLEEGGWDDYAGNFESLEGARLGVVAWGLRYPGRMWWHIVDTTTGEKVEEGDTMYNKGGDDGDR